MTNAGRRPGVCDLATDRVEDSMSTLREA